MGLFKKIFLIAVFLSGISLWGATVPWKEQSTFQFAKGITVRELLQAFFALQEINARIDDKVEGIVNATFDEVSPEAFLDQIVKAYALTWFFDGNVMYINPASQVESQIIRVSSYATNQLLESVYSLGMVSPMSSIRILDGGNVVFVSGPPQYVKMVTTIANQLKDKPSIVSREQAEAIKQKLPKIKIFPLKYACAYDVSFTSHGQAMTIPGIANVLRGLMLPSAMGEPDVISGISSKPIPTLSVSPQSDKLPKMNAMHPALSKAAKDGEPDDTALNAPREQPKPVADAQVMQSLIQADLRLNAVVVRDLEEKMPQYEELIKVLDVPTKIIEISAMIVDINSDVNLGIGNGFFGMNTTNGKPHSWSMTPGASTGAGALSTGFNLTGTTVINGWKFLSQIQALQTDGDAQILSRPSIITLDNLEAVITRDQTFYVELLSERTSDLVNVTVSLMLKVTPRIIEEEKGVHKINLFVTIEDGSVDNGSLAVGGVPGTIVSSVNTQAVVMENQSLLIGGFYLQSKSDSNTGVPILKDIPIIGYAFRNRAKSKKLSERMYLITPRIIDLKHEVDVNVNGCFDEPVDGIAVAQREGKPAPCASACSVKKFTRGRRACRS